MHGNAAQAPSVKSMLKSLRIYGRLASSVGQSRFQVEMLTTADAVRFLLANFPSIERELAQGEYVVMVGGRSLEESELGHPIGQEIVRIVPVIQGAGAVGRIITGVALIAASFFVGPFAPFFFNLGAGLVLGGVAQLLTPTPKQDPLFNDPKSFSFNGIQQNAKEGVPVPIVYGKVIVGSIVVSQGITTNNEVMYIELPVANP